MKQGCIIVSVLLYYYKCITMLLTKWTDLLYSLSVFISPCAAVAFKLKWRHSLQTCLVGGVTEMLQCPNLYDYPCYFYLKIEERVWKLPSRLRNDVYVGTGLIHWIKRGHPGGIMYSPKWFEHNLHEIKLTLWLWQFMITIQFFFCQFQIGI